MKSRSRNLLVAAMILAVVASMPAIAQQNKRIDQEEAGRQGAKLAQDLMLERRDKDPNFSSGGNAGRVVIDGTTYDLHKFVPGASQSKTANNLYGLSEDAGTLDKLKQATIETEQQLARDRGIEGQAFRTFERSAIRVKEEEQKLREDDRFWESTLPHLTSGRQGLINGKDEFKCETQTTVETIPSTAWMEEEVTCDRIPDFGATPLCTREWIDTESTEVFDQDRRALLNIDEGTEGLICRRTRHVESHQETLHQSRAADLEITQETAGQSCTRYRWADAVVVSETKTKETALAVNNDMGGLSCRRERWVEANVTTTNGSRTASLGINTETGGLSCTRRRTASRIPGGSHSGMMVVTVFEAGPGCMTSVEIPVPYSYIQSVTVDRNYPAYLRPSVLGTYPTTNGTVVTIAVDATTLRECRPIPEGEIVVRWNYTIPDSTEFGLAETGNCGDPGTSSCPTKWTCTANAPTTIDGVPVTAAQVQSLPPLYPGAPNTCVRAELRRECSGTVSTSTSVSIADLIPAGTTSIQNFQWVVNNPQSGVTVTLVQTPTQANGWVAVFNVTRSKWGVVQQPQVTLSWQIKQTNYVWSVRDTGGTIITNWGSPEFWSSAVAALWDGGPGVGATSTTTDCSDPGSTACPTQWSCKGSAPTTINGISVTPAMVSSLPALFPGASNTCVTAELNRVCSGPSTLGTSVPLGELIPAGVTQIHDLSFTVLNPQQGVSVQLVVPPTYANGWMAGFEVTRTNYNYQPQPVQIRITFRIEQTSIVLSLRETGNCSDPGSEACPTQWTCSKHAPTTINGNTVTLPMVQSEPALYPGAPSSCVEGILSRVCNGSSAISTQIPIGDLLPEGTTDIFNFGWQVTNPQAGIAVELLEAPAFSNGWTATFKVTRDYSVGGTPAKPNVLLTWSVLGPVEYDYSVITEGDCSGNSDGATSPSCQAQWRCERPLPSTVNDIELTTGMLEEGGGEELFPGENRQCAEAVRERVCSGDGSNLTVIDISEQIPPGITQLAGYGWEIIVPGQGVAVTQIEPPTYENGWKATFQTTRTDWSISPTRPDIRLYWQIQVNTTVPEIREEGDCSAEGDELCQAAWRCVEEFDYSGGDVQSRGEMVVSYFTAPSASTPSWSIASQIPAGVEAIDNFSMEIVQAAPTSIITGIITTPTKDNGWMVRIQDQGRCTSGGGDPGDPGGPNPPVQVQSTGGFAPMFTGGTCGPNIIRFHWDNLTGTGGPPKRDPLYPGAPPTCKRAERYLDCTNINDGEVCHETEQGTVCETVIGGPFDECGELRDNEMCTYQRTICNEDGWGGTPENPVCRIETDVYKCRTQVDGEDILVREHTACEGDLAVCVDGACTEEVMSNQPSNSASMRKAAAQLVIRENMMTDYVVKGTGGGGGGTTPPRDGPPEQHAVLAPVLRAGEQILSGFVAEAAAQDFDPFDTDAFKRGMPEGTPSLPDMFNQVIGEFSADNIKFFDGSSYDCMKALGGLLNCCTRKIDPKQTNTEWWKSFGDILHKKFSENVQCSLNNLTDDQKASGFNFLGEGATFQDLARAFTGLQDRLQGGGNPLNCGSMPRMQDVMNDFMRTMKGEVFPRLGWYCDADEKELGAKKETGTCSYLGDYCRKKILGFCIDKRQRYCCFNSPMTRMIREQLRDMGIKSMGTAKNPDCSGVSPQDFASMNTVDMDTSDLEARMLLAGVFPDLASLLGDNMALLEMLTGIGSSINEGRVNTLDRTNAMLDETIPGLAEMSINEQIWSQVPGEASTPTGNDPGEVSFTTGFRVVNRPLDTEEKEVRIGLIYYGSSGVPVSATVSAVPQTAVSGLDYVFHNQTLTWAPGENGAQKFVTMKVLKRNSTGPVMLSLRLVSTTQAAFGSHSEMTIQIDP